MSGHCRTATQLKRLIGCIIVTVLIKIKTNINMIAIMNKPISKPKLDIFQIFILRA
jgi:hypothetical protein